ncbi:MAG: DUF4142 domain-containing protein [Brevundimonas sp.]|uniref:DUF4142 domain-containing protein n=1 Tax=Brevundimonas sp. TaxID=1871086 RepID=UPI00391A465F
MDQPAPSSMDYLRMAAASDLYEIQSSQLVLQTTQDTGLRAFAQKMIDHHTMTTATLMGAARDAGLTPPAPALDATKSQMIAQLQAAQAGARDALYKQQQVVAHREALALHTSYSTNGDAPQLKTAARTAVPIVAEHYNQITAMHGDASAGHSGH